MMLQNFMCLNRDHQNSNNFSFVYMTIFFLISLKKKLTNQYLNEISLSTLALVT